MAPSPRTKIVRPGFTLIEVLLYVATTSILLVSVSLTHYVTLRSRMKNEVVMEVDAVGRLALERVASTIRNANSITSPALGETQSSLTLAMPESAKNPTVFSLVNGVLQVQEGTQAAVTLTPARTTVGALTFANLGRPGTEGIVRIQFSVSYNANSSRNEYQYSKSFTASAAIR